MESLLPQLTETIAQNSHWAGLVLFVLTLLEALLLVGLLIPIVGVMVMAGALVAQGILHPAEAILWCSAGAIVGDGLSFLLGRGLGARRLARGLLAGHRRLVARARLLSRRHGLIAIGAARFLGPLRPFVPIVAGMSRSRPWAFQAASALTAPLWVISMLAPGYLAARNLHLLTSDPVAGAAFAAGAAVLAIAGYMAWKRFAPVSARAARLAV
ncbi:DedA family protein [Caulobacter sp. ErkDOM-YI]|uniref:DedA family protein n=1 Tax=unclassified Caulobacter TaxID=2648921 RepID=UPI003AF54678